MCTCSTRAEPDSVITSSGAAGRLLGHAVHEPRVTEVLEDLLSVGEGLDIGGRRPVEESEAWVRSRPSSSIAASCWA